MAEVVERLEQGNGAYHLTETWKGQGMYRLLGRATRVSKGELAQLGPGRASSSTSAAAATRSASRSTGAPKRSRGATRGRRGPSRCGGCAGPALFPLALAYLAQRASRQLSDRRRANAHLRPNGRERLATPAGHFETLKVIRRKEGTGDVSEIWLAAELGYLPVRIVLVEDGGRATNTW